MPTPLETFREARGRDITSIAQQSVASYFIALSLAVLSGIQTVVDLLLLPFTLAIDVGTASANAFFIEPLRLTTFGTYFSAISLEGFGIAALPVSFIVVLVSFAIVVGFLALSITSNTFPGLLVDNPIWDFFFGTPEEEVEGED